MRPNPGDVRALIFDVDGTLVNDEKVISLNLISLVRRVARNREIRTILASSRSDRSLRLITDVLGVECGLVCFDGGLVLDQTCTKIHESFLDVTMAPEALAAGLALDLTCSLFDTTGWFTSDGGYWTQREIRGTGIIPMVVDGSDLAARVDAEESVYKIMFRGEQSKIDELCGSAAMRKMCKANTGYSNRPTIYEILPKAADKFEGCKSILTLWGLGPGACIFFGDGVNDISCLSGFPHSVAMANADEKVKRHGRYRAGRNDEDGIFRYLARLFDA